jgi:hypothetical protein
MAVKYFNSGFLTLDGDILLKITDISLNYSVDSDEITSFDSDFNKEYYPTFSNWTVSASAESLLMIQLNQVNFLVKQGFQVQLTVLQYWK